MQLTDGIRLSAGQHARNDLIHARHSAHSLCGALVIARQHDNANAHSAQLGYCLSAVLLDRVGNRYNAAQSAVTRKEQGCFALAR